MIENIVITKACICTHCHQPFSTSAKERAKCPRCGRSTKVRPYYKSDDPEKVAKAVRLKTKDAEDFRSLL